MSEITLKNRAAAIAKPAIRMGKADTVSWNNFLFRVVTGMFLICTFLPMVSVLLFSAAKKWTTTIMPETWTLEAYINIFRNAEFIGALGRSFVVSSSAALISLGTVTLALLGASLAKNKTAVAAMEAVTIVPVALPGIVLALSCIIFYGRVFPILLGRPILLIFVESAFDLPFVFWTLRNTFRGLDIVGLYEAASILGAPARMFISRVLLPNISKGLLAAGVMAFTITFNNFAL